MVALVQTMLDPKKRLPDAKTTSDRDLISHQIAATDKQTDALVYELHGLSEDGILIVEGAGQGQSVTAPGRPAVRRLCRAPHAL